MVKKVLFALLIAFVLCVSISNVNASWFFDEGQDVNVNGVNFHIPQGFNMTSYFDVGEEGHIYSSRATFKNNEYNEGFVILVYTSPNTTMSIQDFIYNFFNSDVVLTDKSISGKNGVIASGEYNNQRTVTYGYCENNKVVFIECSYSFHDGAKYDNVLSEIIK